jgi:3-oxoacyl-[acyl-carrier protein] reductase
MPGEEHSVAAWAYRQAGVVGGGMIDPGLQDKVVLVTGANNPFGIGAAIAEAFAVQGTSIFITYLRSRPEEFGIDAAAAAKATTPGEEFYRARNADAPDAVLGRLRGHAARIELAEIDLADPEAVPQLFDQVEKTLGSVDILINNAAYSISDSFIPAPSTVVDWAGRIRSMVDANSHDRHFAVNSRAVALLMAEYVRRHVNRGAVWGRVVNISTDGADCFPGEVSYGASKAALESYSRSAANELARYGITVNMVAPGPIQTGWIPVDAEEPIVESIPLGRMGQPADVADVVVFLASEQARWVTGQRLFVGGGHRV